MDNGKASGFTIILFNSYICEDLIIIVKYIPLAVTLNNQFIALLYMHIKVAKYEPFVHYTIIYVIQSQNVFLGKITNDDTCLLTSSVSPSLPIFNI